MKRTIATAIMGTMLSAGPAAAGTYVANFNTSTLDPALVFTGGAGYTLTSGGGFLTLALAEPASSSTVTINPSVYTRFITLGDYTARVTLDFSGQQNAGSGSGSGAFVAHDGLDDFTVLGTDKSATGGFVTGYQSLSGVGTAAGYANSSTNVTLQFQRIGHTLIESFAEGGTNNFQTLGVLNDPSYGGAASFTLSSLYSGTAGATGVLRFSNFVISTPDPAAVPEPASWIAMILGFGLVGYVLRARPRWLAQAG